MGPIHGEERRAHIALLDCSQEAVGVGNWGDKGLSQGLSAGEWRMWTQRGTSQGTELTLEGAGRI